ncbi:MAG: class II glutamine amidotransferase, partial [Stackebrandtia sp.]
GRLNLLAADGETLAAVAFGDTLFTRQDDDSIVLASEPFDDDPLWRETPPDRLVVAGRSGLTTTDLTVEES